MDVKGVIHMNTIIAIVFTLSMSVITIFTIYDFKERRKEYREETKVDSEVYRKK